MSAKLWLKHLNKLKLRQLKKIATWINRYDAQASEPAAGGREETLPDHVLHHDVVGHVCRGHHLRHRDSLRSGQDCPGVRPPGPQDVHHPGKVGQSVRH